MAKSPSTPSEMAFFNVLARCESFSRAARELGLSTPAVSKRLAQMEARLGVQLLSRTTRRVAVTAEGQTYLMHTRRILDEIDELDQLMLGAAVNPKGLLRINATLGFGRSHIAPLLSDFTNLHPEIQIQLQLSVDTLPLAYDSFDVCVRFGAPPDARAVAKYLAPNRRLLCASPAYLAKNGTPLVPDDLTRHDCLVIRQGDSRYGSWSLALGKRAEIIKLSPKLSTNDGEIAVSWALAGHGIVMRAEWDIARYLRSGRLVQVLENYHTPKADLHVFYQQRHQVPARVQAIVNYLTVHFEKSSVRAAGMFGSW